MYQPTYSSAPSPYTSPPPPSGDPYRSSPIAVAQVQPYNATFSPPPIPPAVGGYPSMPSVQSQRFQQYPNSSGRSGSYPKSSNNRSGSSVPSIAGGGFSNGFAQSPQPQPQTHSQKHKGTLPPGQIVTVGEHTVKVERYLSEGGYAHVYLTSSDRPIYPPSKTEKKGRWGEKGFTEHCLKRIAFEDESVWTDVKKEIEVMKALPPTPHLVQYLGSTHTRTAKGGHEVFILMEFCAGGGIIDLLNKRLRDRLKEIEILNIFTDVCEAVAAMHALKQPLLHRDLKIENVLSHPSSSPPSPQRPTPLTFKLCDFGSTTFPAAHPPATKVEADALALDLNRHTTLQYRSPEMVEPMLGFPVGLPSDVWALGVLLYKLCYYTTPFEEHGTLAIVNAKYTFPQYPVYSPRLQHLIASMLVEQPIRRPSVFDILKVAHEMSGTRPEIDYPDSTSRSIAKPISQQSFPHQPTSSAGNNTNLLDFTSPNPIASTPVMAPSLADSVQPGRRGRPTREGSGYGSSKLPPMPQPPIMPASHPVSALQVTGEKLLAKSPSPSSSLDAFGAQSFSPSALPSVPTQQIRHAGFKSPSPSQSLDAFGASTKPQPVRSSSGFADAFGAKAFQPTSKFGQSLAKDPSGFGDAFVSSPLLSPSLSLKQATGSTPQQESKQESTPSVPPSAQAKPKAVSAVPIPHAEDNFETRFPSIETLSNGPTSPAMEEPSTSTSSALRPLVNTRPSMMGNLTGGDLTSPHTAAPSVSGAPQPRSTHVTGTAFKESSILSPSSLKSGSDYLQVVSDSSRAASPAPTTPPIDLMSGDDANMLQAPAMLPNSSGSSATAQAITPQTSTTFSAQLPPSTGHSRPLLPKIDSARPTTNFNSAQWSPLERMRSSSNIPTKVNEPDSSDEEGPEQPISVRQPSPQPLESGRKSASPSKSLAERMAAFQSQSTTNSQSFRSLSPSKASPSKSATTPSSRDFQPAVSGGTASRTRPQSMYAMPSSTSPSKSVLPSAQNDNLTPPTRPGHNRQGSITDMVSKFENLKPSQSNTHIGSGAGSSRPVVAAKPVGLRKPSLDIKSGSNIEMPTSTSSPTKVKSMSLPPKPVKPTMIRPATKYGETPQPEGYSKSSSGRSFPVTKAKPNFIPNIGLETQDEKTEARTIARDSTALDGITQTAAAKNGSGTQPSDERQPVNALIARWNKGEVGAKPVIKPKPIL